MLLRVLTRHIGAQSRTVKDQSYRFACTTCGARLALGSDYSLILTWLTTVALTGVATASWFGGSGLKWAIPWTLAAVLTVMVTALDTRQRVRHPKLLGEAPTDQPAKTRNSPAPY